MSTFLHRLGRLGFSKPWAFIGAWAVILGVVFGTLAVGGGKISDSVTIEGTPSQRVLDTLAERLPAASGSQGSIVFTVPEGERLDTPERQAALAQAARAVYDDDLVVNPAQQAEEAAKQAAQAGPEAQAALKAQQEAAQQAARQAAEQAAAGGGQPRPLVVGGQPVPGILVSARGDVALFSFQLEEQVQDLPEDATAGVVEAADSAVEQAGITATPSESLQKMEPPVGATEGFGLIIAALVLVLTLGSLRAAGLPLITALVGVAAGVGGAFALSHSFTMSATTPALALMVGLAVGIDYALFIVNRQRRLILFQGLDAREAAARAVGTAGSAVFFAGLTVVIALASLSIIGISMLTTMAFVAAATVLFAVLIALTLLPALLGLVGEKIASSKARAKRAEMTANEDHGLANRVVTGIVRRPVVVMLAAVAVMGVAAIPMASMTLGMPSGASANLDTTARQSYDAITRGFGEGYNAPLLVTAEPTTPGAAIEPQDLAAMAGAIGAVDDVKTVTPMGVLPTGDLAIFSVIPESGPDDEVTVDLVQGLRASDSAVAQEFGVDLGVTGLTAINIDISKKLGDVLPVYLAIIVGLSLVILTLVFRSLVIPVVATLGFLLSIVATFGLTTAVFQWGWAGSVFGIDSPGPVISMLPIMVTGILYGLAMDYQVFLVTSMREAHVHGYKGVDAVVHGFDQASRVVVAAAVIMTAVFAGFIFSHDAMIKQFGLALAAGIVIDAFLVRMLVIPASMALLGERAWWMPRWMERVLPDLDVEGDRLMARLEQDASAQEPVATH
ncbi:MMPL family transporter [Knoellia sp. p5-6-4]|uniref:MMPL family transporter n=1 Tax=unclassified Knoellia TaxID=2618719 RepID=UPI0023DA17F5|nr:MMPL family transporter [Knoellia sp. p5-6-4]MDF2143842.1 MMPL family transporter [Knoellia sp. p5-6-4]